MNEETNPRHLKRIDFEKGVFEANGKTYTVEGTLSIERYAEFQIFEKELGYGYTVQAIFDKIKKIWDLLNKMKFAEIAVILSDLMRGMAKIQEREPVILKICALFINTENEDRTTITKDLMDAKILDWKKEGIAMQDFFTLASNSVHGFSETYKAATRIISGLEGNEAGESQ